MLNMPHVLVTGHKEIEPELNWEFLPYWLVFAALCRLLGENMYQCSPALSHACYKMLTCQALYTH